MIITDISLQTVKAAPWIVFVEFKLACAKMLLVIPKNRVCDIDGLRKAVCPHEEICGHGSFYGDGAGFRNINLQRCLSQVIKLDCISACDLALLPPCANKLDTVKLAALLRLCKTVTAIETTDLRS